MQPSGSDAIARSELCCACFARARALALCSPLSLQRLRVIKAGSDHAHRRSPHQSSHPLVSLSEALRAPVSVQRQAWGVFCQWTVTIQTWFWCHLCSSETTKDAAGWYDLVLAGLCESMLYVVSRSRSVLSACCRPSPPMTSSLPSHSSSGSSETTTGQMHAAWFTSALLRTPGSASLQG